MGIEITDQQAEINQKVIDLIWEYIDSDDDATADADFNPKALLKYLRNKGYEIHFVGASNVD